MDISYPEYLTNIRRIEASLRKHPNLYPDKGQLAEKHPNVVSGIIYDRERTEIPVEPFTVADFGKVDA